MKTTIQRAETDSKRIGSGRINLSTFDGSVLWCGYLGNVLLAFTRMLWTALSWGGDVVFYLRYNAKSTFHRCCDSIGIGTRHSLQEEEGIL